ncbi:PDR/VanB family oxidoreductase [Methylobrevis albus]|uniref:Oxidoreductase n=1 Tax=Methylobrevis albus TaxID=2793297 RepID=A0A931MX80_9HYPH|nr:PDR/VanB family oxidoreductase [Methylobrevis albus]MBH0236425.1 oxidoreductase [Methylobrevis albus]
MIAPQIRVRVRDVEEVARRVKRFRLEPADGGALPAFSGGAHVTVSMPAGGARPLKNPYSLTGAPGETAFYEIGVEKVEGGRGGSAFMHEAVRPGTELFIAPPANLFPLVARARKHLFVAGGIGITPFLAMAAQAAARGDRFELHYAARTSDDCAFADLLMQRYGGAVHFYHSDRGARLDLAALVAHQPLGTHLYVCGPERLITATLDAGRCAGWPEQHLHAEHFASPPSGDPFDIRIAGSDRIVPVAADQSMLEALEAAGLAPRYLCRGGACGECETAVVACDGTLEHHDHFLSDADKAAGKKVMICISRLKGREVTLVV